MKKLTEKRSTEQTPLELLEYYKEDFDKQKGNKNLCSNQTALCGIVTKDREKAIEFMKDKNIVTKRERHDQIVWVLDNGEKWMWCVWNEHNRRGRRFYKIAVDKFIDIDLFRVMVPRCDNYCCSLEII